MAKYRKKPVVIEAAQWTGVNPGEIAAFMNRWDIDVRGERLRVPTLEGEMWADPGDWIIRGVQGELYPCKPDIFAATYESVEGSEP